MSKNKEKTEKFSFKNIFTGRFLTEEFVSKQLKLLVLIVGLIIVFISNNFACEKKLAEIEHLKKKLEDVKYENRALSTRLTSASRHTQVKALLEQKGINLSSPTSPAFEIQK